MAGPGQDAIQRVTDTKLAESNQRKAMSQTVNRFSGQVDQAWLDRLTEPVLEPELSVIDPHHHLWVRDGNIYLLPELLADLGSGHNVIATVFEECHSMYRANGPEEKNPSGKPSSSPASRQWAPAVHLVLAECVPA